MVIYSVKVKGSAQCFNPYWQILVNSSRNFSGISVLRVISQTVLMESLSNFISKFQLRGHESDRFTGKIIHVNFMSYSVLVKYRVRR